MADGDKASFREHETFTVNPLFACDDDKPGAAGDGHEQTHRVYDVADWKTFLSEPAPDDGVVFCQIKREKSGMSGVCYKLMLEQSPELGMRFLMAARKVMGSFKSNYHVWCDENPTLWTDKTYFGKLRCVEGRKYCFYDGGNNPSRLKGTSIDVRREYGAVLFEMDQGTGRPHKTTAMLPGVQQQRRPTSQKDSILEDYALGKTAGMLLLRNKQPRWSEEQGIYCLKFKGRRRVLVASAKNCMLVTPENDDFVYLQLGKMDDSTFSLDFRYPLNPLQAFSLALATMDVS